MGVRRKTLAEVQVTLNERWGSQFRILEYDGSSKPGKFECTKCGTGFRKISNIVVRYGACPCCSEGRGGHKKTKAKARGKLAAEASGHELIKSEPSGNQDRGWRHHFHCHKHGRFSVVGLSSKPVCPKCRGYISPNDPDLLPRNLRGKPCDLYLIEIRDSVGYWTKIGISTNWPSRKRNYSREGVVIIREIRMYRTTLYEALVIERDLKRWMRKTLGRRKCPRRKWSGWSESAMDPNRRFPGEFDKAIVLAKSRKKE